MQRRHLRSGIGLLPPCASRWHSALRGVYILALGTRDAPQWAFLGFLALIGLFGFVLGIFFYITMFLRLRARVGWVRCSLGALGAVLVLAAFSELLVLDYPQGLLPQLVDMPSPLN